MMEDEFYFEAYKRYREKLKQTSWFAEPVSYDWLTLPSEISFEWFLYHKMLNEHIRQLANAVNQLLRDTVKLSTWANLACEYTDEEKLYLITEFIGHIAAITLNLPYVIRSRFIFSVAHLCHQANRIKDANWKDTFPNDKSINFKTMEKFSKGWDAYGKFKQSLTKLSNDKFNVETTEFRNKFHHQLPVLIEIGLSSLLSRKKNASGSVSYGLGGIKPLSLNKIVPLLEEQHSAALLCFSSYQELIEEQINQIFSHKAWVSGLHS